jgi:DNA-binding FadR family transcriptional regulator
MSEPKKGAAQAAAETIRWRILSGMHRPGESLPGERELSEELGISRLTLRSALAHLENEGLVRAVHGSGTRVLDYRESGGVELLARLAKLALTGAIPGGLDVFGSLLELRRAVAIEAVGLAAERATPEELRTMRDHVAMQEKLVGDPHAFMIADLAFARLMVRATKNLGIELLFNTVSRSIEEMPGIELAFSLHAPNTVKIYRRLLDRMEAREGGRLRMTAARLLGRLDRTTMDALRRAMGTVTHIQSAKAARRE